MMIPKGIAFHHSGLASKQKSLVEDEFRNGKIKVICATPTLAAGLSLPVFRVILKSLKRYSGRFGMNWIPVLEYLQMAGRAGRPEYEKFGEAIAIVKSESEKDEVYNRYVLGEPEEIYSKLAVEPVLRMYLLSLISSGLIRDENSMRSFFSKTFWAAQYGDMEELESIMQKMLSLLWEWEFLLVDGKVFVDSDESDKARVSSTGDFVTGLSLVDDESSGDLGDGSARNRSLRVTAIGRRIAELYLDPLTAALLIGRLKEATSRDSNGSDSSDKKSGKVNAFSYLQMISHTLEMRPLLRIKVKEQEMVQGFLLDNYEFLLESEPDQFDLEYDEFMQSIKTAGFFEAWINEIGEDKLLEVFNIRPGEIRYKLENANWLIYSCIEICEVLGLKSLKRDLVRLRIRVKNGVREELLSLLRLKGIGRKRARLLFSNGIKDVGDLKESDSGSLGKLLGTKVAANVKEQLGQKVDKVKDGKRKGQLGLGKYV